MQSYSLDGSPPRYAHLSITPPPWRRRRPVVPAVPKTTRSRAAAYVRQLTGDAGRARAVAIVAEGLLEVHHDLPARYAGPLTPAQRRRLAHKHRKAAHSGAE